MSPKRSAPRVLVVEDTPAVAELILLVLRRAGYAAETVATGTDALLRIEGAREVFSVVLLDLGLPDVPGTRVLDTLHARWPGLPVAVVTGSTRPVGADEYLVKPLDLCELVQVVGRLAARRELVA